jgi:hypothetical protein
MYGKLLPKNQFSVKNGQLEFSFYFFKRVLHTVLHTEISKSSPYGSPYGRSRSRQVLHTFSIRQFLISTSLYGELYGELFLQFQFWRKYFFFWFEMFFRVKFSIRFSIRRVWGVFMHISVQIDSNSTNCPRDPQFSTGKQNLVL